MAEAVFARKQVEKLALQQSAAVLAPFFTVFARLAENLFVRYRPGNTRDWQSENEQRNDLLS
jgi:hypothetical protein